LFCSAEFDVWCRQLMITHVASGVRAHQPEAETVNSRMLKLVMGLLDSVQVEQLGLYLPHLEHLLCVTPLPCLAGLCAYDMLYSYSFVPLTAVAPAQCPPVMDAGVSRFVLQELVEQRLSSLPPSPTSAFDPGAPIFVLKLTWAGSRQKLEPYWLEATVDKVYPDGTLRAHLTTSPQSKVVLQSHCKHRLVPNVPAASGASHPSCGGDSDVLGNSGDVDMPVSEDSPPPCVEEVPGGRVCARSGMLINPRKCCLGCKSCHLLHHRLHRPPCPPKITKTVPC
jgi:hypothetical protein